MKYNHRSLYNKDNGTKSALSTQSEREVPLKLFGGLK